MNRYKNTVWENTAWTITADNAVTPQQLKNKWAKVVKYLKLDTLDLIIEKGRNGINHLHAITETPEKPFFPEIKKVAKLNRVYLQYTDKKTITQLKKGFTLVEKRENEAFTKGYTLTELMACILIAVALLGIGMDALGWVKTAWEQHNDPTTPLGQLYSVTQNNESAAHMLSNLGATNSVGGVQ